MSKIKGNNIFKQIMLAIVCGGSFIFFIIRFAKNIKK